ncbi:putative SAM-dependent methyltransfera [Nocardioidaceae bacterium Broad-1]|nr:putative SAM-dependent methyltransfera [Nocardioidaceae bacterium Broad-1]
MLDVGAGGGRAALELQQRGHEVVALDSSPGAVEVCRRQGVEQAIHGTLSTYDHRAGFDTYLFFGNNLGLLESTAHGRAVLGAIADAARPGAVIVGTSMRPELTSNPTHLHYHERNRARGRWPGQLRLRSRYRDQASGWFDYLLIDPEGLDEVLVTSDWRRDATFEEEANYAAVLSRQQFVVRE